MQYIIIQRNNRHNPRSDYDNIYLDREYHGLFGHLASAENEITTFQPSLGFSRYCRLFGWTVGHAIGSHQHARRQMDSRLVSKISNGISHCSSLLVANRFK